jgi:hypothetical protein
MPSKFAQAIFDKLFVPDGKRFVVSLNRDKMLFTQKVTSCLEGDFGVRTYYGGSLDLRIVRETVVTEEPDAFILFVMKEDFPLMEDIADDASFVNFQFRSFFPLYPWEAVKLLSFEQLDWLYAQPQFIDIGSLVKEGVLCDSAGEKPRSEEAFEDLLRDWYAAEQEIDFNRPTEWMQKASEILLSAIEMDRLADMQREIAAVNEEFLDFLQGSYVNIVSSTCGTKYPRIVTQVLPFISKQPDEKTALVVIDGMNYWQALLLTRSLEEHLNIRAKYDCIYAWLPSVTELSRQAIFRGDIPVVEYDQSPSSEAKLWKEFWSEKGVPAFQQYYQHSGSIAEEMSVNRLGYVVVDLDEKMHASDNFMYLYDATKRWVAEEEIVGNIRHLIDGGYKVYITTDHGNIEASAYRKLDSRDKLGANLSLRHITLPAEADKAIFEAQYEGHLVQVDPASKTYYAKEKEAFTSKERCVTHGGAHWLEVLIPFITIEK